MAVAFRASVVAGDQVRATSSSFLNFKCCVVGDSSVGKTSMLMAYCLEDWRPNKGGFIPPTYVPSRPFLVPCADSRACITLTVKDTRGGPEMDELRAYDCSGADCLLVCFSVVDPESYFNVETKWLPFMARVCPDAACILVGTKTDMRQPQQPQQPNRRISTLQSPGGSEQPNRRISTLQPPGGSEQPNRRISTLQPPGGSEQPSRRISTLQSPGGADSAVAAADDGGGAGGRSSKRISALEVNTKMGMKMAKKLHAFEYLECSSLDKKSLDAVFNTAIRTFTEEPDGSANSSGAWAHKDKTDAGEKSKKKCQIS